MMWRDRIGVLAILGSVLIALVLLSAGLAQLSFSPGQPVMLTGPDSRSVFVGIITVALIILALSPFVPVLVGLFARLPDQRRSVIKRLLAIAGLVTLSFVLFELQRDPTAIPEPSQIFAVPTEVTDPRLLPTPRSFPTPAPATGERTTVRVPEYGDPPQWLGLVLAVLLIAPLSVAVWYFWSRGREEVAEKPAPDVLVAQQAQQALAGLQTGGDVRDTVLRCYLEMSAVLSERRGVQRRPDMTVREFERRLADAGIADAHVRRLTRLFERIRYGAKAAGSVEKDEAVACLQSIVQAYGRPR